MEIKAINLVLLSACVWTISFMCPHALGCLIVGALAPLFLAIMKGTNLRAGHGMLWGLSVYGIQFHGLYVVTIEHSKHLFFGIFCVTMLIIYMSLLCAGWFWLTFVINVRWSTWIRCVWAVIATTFFFLLVEQYGFWGLGIAHGYCFANPLLPLAAHPAWLALGSYLPVDLVTMLAVTVSMFIATLWHTGRTYGLSIVGGCFTLSWFVQPKLAPPSLLHEISFVPMQMWQETPLDYAQYINAALERAAAKKPTATIFITAESAFPFCLNDHQDCCALWQQNCLVPDRVLLLGSHKRVGDKRYNCLFFVNHSRIMNDYVKKELFPFTEYIPWLWRNTSHMQSFFLRFKKEFSSINNQLTREVAISGQLTCCPYICADLFFDGYPTEKNLKVPIVCVVNDAWFSSRYLRNFMALFARLTAVKKGCTIIYVTPSRGGLITPQGYWFDME